jgi:hypothetical protein
MRKAIVASILFLISFETLPCVCFFSLDKKFLEQRFRDSDVIFYGILTKYPKPDTLLRSNEVAFYVIKTWKGGVSGPVKVKQMNDECGPGAYKVGESYVVWAHFGKQDSQIYVGGCGSIAEHEPDVTSLNQKNFFKLLMNFLDAKIGMK